jgi:hypothetical protein
VTDKIPYRRLIIEGTKVFADDLGEGRFSLAFEFASQPGMTVILDRPTLVQLQSQIAHALKPQA